MSAPFISRQNEMSKTNYYISHEILESWPDAGLFKGQHCLVYPGRTLPGQIIAIYYSGDLFLNLLMLKDGDGNIAVKGSDGYIRHLHKDEYEIEGFVAYENFTP